MGVHCMIYMTNEKKSSRNGLHQCIGSAVLPVGLQKHTCTLSHQHLCGQIEHLSRGSSHARVMCVSNPSEFRAQGRKRVLLRGAVRCLLTVQMLISCLVLLMDDKVSIQGSLAGFPKSDGVNCFSWFLRVFIKLKFTFLQPGA